LVSSSWNLGLEIWDLDLVNVAIYTLCSFICLNFTSSPAPSPEGEGVRAVLIVKIIFLAQL